MVLTMRRVLPWWVMIIGGMFLLAIAVGFYLAANGSQATGLVTVTYKQGLGTDLFIMSAILVAAGILSFAIRRFSLRSTIPA
jgi:hypothetical protein